MESIVTSSAEDTGPTRSADELWLDVLQQIAARTAHELRGALNGVVVNLEVVRSRAAKSGAAAASIVSFASSAADQLDAVVDMTEALLALARPPREPLDVLETVKALASLLAPSARAAGGSLRLETPSRDVVVKSVRASGNVVRVVVGGALLAALACKGDVRCRVEAGEETVVSIDCLDAEAPLELADEVQAVAAAAGVRVQQERHSFSLVFPRAGAARQRTPETA
jgi:signal transduction histidine kinase